MTEVIELRQYALHPGRRDVLIELFDREFVESQEAEGMRILGQFRDLDEPDHFVWMRSFPDMPKRAEALTSFYTGPAWKANSAAANATMIAVDNVLLLRPTGPGTAFRLDEAVRDTPAGSLVVATIYHLPEPPDDDRLRFFDSTMLPLVKEAGGTPIALLQTEYAENNFPPLPVRTGEHVLLHLASFPDEQAYARHLELTGGVLPDTVERLRLSPTDRSMLR
jgi:hypothetical protein